MAAFYKIVRLSRPSRSYFIRHAGQLHSLKAVATYALQQRKTAFRSRDFHAVDAAKRLRELGFDVVHNAGDKDGEPNVNGCRGCPAADRLRSARG